MNQMAAAGKATADIRPNSVLAISHMNSNGSIDAPGAEDAAVMATLA
jgi:hypothetical protein